MDKTIRVVLVGFLLFLAVAALVLGFVLLNTDLYDNSTSTYEGPPIIIFLMALLGVLGLMGGVILYISKR